MTTLPNLWLVRVAVRPPEAQLRRAKGGRSERIRPGINPGRLGEYSGEPPRILTGGRGEIRTRDRVLHDDSFQDCCLKPLGHPSM